MQKMQKIRGFERVSAFSENDVQLPLRATAHSAGYDIAAAEDIEFQPGEIKAVPTGLKAYMQADEVLYLYDRSSNPTKRGLVLANSVGVIDSDYYNNAGNEGQLFVQLMNITDKPVSVAKGDRIAQAVFAPFLVADDDAAEGLRTGGFGSTGD